MSKTTPRTRDLARAALLRERILGALRAAPAPMEVGELYTMSSIAELYHKTMIPQKVGQQIKALLRSGDVVKVEYGVYAINRDKQVDRSADHPATQGDVLQSLQLEVDRRNASVAFTLAGVRITVKVI